MGLLGFPVGSAGKESACNAGDTGLTQVCGEDPLERGMATYFSILLWRRILEKFSLWRIQGQRSLVGHSPWGHKEADMTEQLSIHRIISLALLLSPGNVHCALWLLVSCHFLPKLDQSDDPKQILGPLMDI